MNTTYKNTADLREAIKNLEQEQLNQKKKLSESYSKKIQSYKPANILKSSISNLSPKTLRNTAVIAGAGIGAAFLLRKFLVKKAVSIPLTALGFIGKAAFNYAISHRKNKQKKVENEFN
jgi:hypothetical protein